MIVVDASAAVALLNAEPQKESLAEKIAADSERRMSPVSYTEVIMVLAKLHPEPKLVAEAFLRDMDIKLIAIEAKQAELAVHAFLFFGKGRHRARLNLGDCFSYAAAKAHDAALLFVGDDFTHTDVRSP